MSVKLQRNPSVLRTGSNRQDISISAYEQALLDLAHDKKLERDLAVGRQIGFYRIRGELGSGNFSQVKLGIHILTRGEPVISLLYNVCMTAVVLVSFFVIS